ncbi:MAG: lysylphosphatidylglycerol synthase transmembrane domain-containing protein [Halobacteriales archaeon]
MSVPASITKTRAKVLRQAAAAAVIPLVLLGVLGMTGSLSGVGTALSGADVSVFAVVVGAALCVLVLRGLTLRVLLEILGHRPSVGRILPVYVATVAVSTLLPGGQATGAPINGYLVSRPTGVEYEDGIAAVVGISALSNLVVGLSGVFGAAYLLATTNPGNGITTLAVLAVALFCLAALVAVALLRARDRLASMAVSLITRLGRKAAFLPGVPEPERDAVARHVERFRDALDRFRDATTGQVVALVGLLGAAHFLTVVALWLSLAAVGTSVPIGVVIAVIPAGVVAAAVPTPGGFGGIEVALVGLLTAGTSAAASTATAATVIYQIAMVGPALLAGGSVLTMMLLMGLLQGIPESQ